MMQISMGTHRAAIQLTNERGKIARSQACVKHVHNNPTRGTPHSSASRCRLSTSESWSLIPCSLCSLLAFSSGSPGTITAGCPSALGRPRIWSTKRSILCGKPGMKKSGSMATKVWPRFAPSSAPSPSSSGLCQVLTSRPKLESARTPPNTSTSMASPYPLYPPFSSKPPSGINPPLPVTEEWTAASASSVGSPDGPTDHPSGSLSPLRWATSTFPRATALVAMSSTKGSRPLVGAARAIGFVPRAGFFALVGTTRGLVFVMLMPIRPWSRAIIA
mmetsp:Transcript_10160/g.35071  ORF Transcript_10160/g.35071 Transcript_10160/m.35071 type:complete len:275 (-) Transcript_10160:495-1319(-)